MKPFDIGTKVQVLHSTNDNAPDWQPGTVTGIVRPNMKGLGQAGNVVTLDSGQQLTVTEPGMIVEDEVFGIYDYVSDSPRFYHTETDEL